MLKISLLTLFCWPSQAKICGKSLLSAFFRNILDPWLCDESFTEGCILSLTLVMESLDMSCIWMQRRSKSIVRSIRSRIDSILVSSGLMLPIPSSKTQVNHPFSCVGTEGIQPIPSNKLHLLWRVNSFLQIYPMVKCYIVTSFVKQPNMLHKESGLPCFHFCCITP